MSGNKTDPMTLVGLSVALVSTFAAMFMGGIDPIGVFFSSPSSIIIVVGGTLGATIASGTKQQATSAGKVLAKAMTGGFDADAPAAVGELVGFADSARREGLLSLEPEIAEIEDPFLKKGLELAVDGTDPEVLRDMLEIEIDRVAQRHSDGASFFTTAAGYAPAFGVAGTVIGLIDMLGKLDDPAALGPSIAVAFITTLWGVFLANYVLQPLASKLRRISADELAHRELLLEGILSIQSGANPRSLAGKLASFLPPDQQAVVLDDDPDEERKSA